MGELAPTEAPPALPLSYPEDEQAIVGTFQHPAGRLWLRAVARLMEWLTDVQPKQLNYSQVTPTLAVGGAFRSNQITRLKARGVTAVVDCREEAQDDADLLAANDIAFLSLPTEDRYALSYDNLARGAAWVTQHLRMGGNTFVHCEHGVGRGPLMACAVLIASGHSAVEALHMVRAARWQAMPNDRQLEGLLEFEQRWRSEHPVESAAP